MEHTQCVEIEEEENVFLSLSYDQDEMNRIFTRISLFSEGGFDIKAGEGVVDRNLFVLPMLHEFIGGHNLKRAEILGFYDFAEKNNIALTPYEQAFKVNVIDKIVAKTEGNFVITAIALKSNMAPKDVASHEILHAQYMHSPEYQAVVDTRWEGLAEPERKAFIDAIPSIYDKTNNYVMKNETQAYLLQNGAEFSYFKHLVPGYREDLMKRLKAANVWPIQVK